MACTTPVTRLYDGTVATDYYRAMAVAEQRLNVDESASNSITDSKDLLTLVDTLERGSLDEEQRKALKGLRKRILLLSDF